jgi:excisionase family DNA binding protein
MIDLGRELTAWLSTAEVRASFAELVREVVREEVRHLLSDELLDVEQAAQMLQMSKAALRKAVERGQVPCERIGSRLRFRRMSLLAPPPPR